MKKKKPKTTVTKAQKQIRKVPVGSGLVKKTSKILQKRQKRQKALMDELF